LETDDGFFDWAAPALTLPGSSVAPFSSKNTLYSIEAFWGLMLLPAAESSTLPAHLLRTIWNQALLGEIAGSLKLSLNTVPTIYRSKERMAAKQSGNAGDLREPSALANRLLKWSCPTRSSLACIRHLFQNMHQLQYVTARGLAFVESWISDLQRSHYLEPPVIPRRRGSMNPCLGADGLYGVAFYPALPPHVVSAEQEQRRNTSLQRYLSEEALFDSLHNGQSDARYRYQLDQLDQLDDTLIPRSILGNGDQISKERKGSEWTSTSTISSRHTRLLESFGDVEEMPLLREFTDLACPGYSHLLPHQSQNPTSNVLLIVAMNSVRYDLIPMFEVIYREQFRNILYCGDPHESIEIFLRKYQLSEDRSFSFLPIHTKYTYECVLGAIEMGFNVDGYIMTSDDALINSWNIPKLNTSRLWYGGDYDIQVTANEWRSLDPGSQKLPRSLDGVLKVLEFLKSSLIGSADEKIHHQREKREAEIHEAGSLVNRPADAQQNPLETIDLLQLKSFHLPPAKYNVQDTNTSVDEDYHDLVEIHPQQVDGVDNATVKARSSDDIDDMDQEELLDLFPQSDEESDESAEEPEEPEEAEEPEEEAEEAETERPVSELLHQLLVATRHNSSGETEPVAGTNSSAATVSFIIPPPPSPPKAAPTNSTTPEAADTAEESSTEATASTTSTTWTTPASVQRQTTTDPSGIASSAASAVPTAPPTSAPLSVQAAPSTESNRHQRPTWNSDDEKHKEISAADEEYRNTDAHVSETLATLQEIYTLIQDNLGVPNDPGYEADLKGSFYGGERSPYRLNPKSIHHFHCEKGNSLEFCKVSSDFLYQLSENTGKSLRLIYDDIPMYFIPRKDQLKFYLLSNLMLQHGVTDEIAIPLIATGLSAGDDWLKLGKSHFGAIKTNDASPLFDPYAVVLHPADLNTIRTDARVHKIFCLKYLLRILQF